MKTILISLILMASALVPAFAQDDKALIEKLFSSAEKHQEDGNHDAAIGDYGKIIALAPDEADAYYGRGYSYLGKLEYARAIADFTKALEIEPNNFYALYGRGRAYFKKGEYELAIDDHTQELNLQKNRDIAFIGRGDAYRMLNELDEAIAQYSVALLIDQKAATYLARGSTFEAKGDRIAAIADFRYYLEIVPDDEETRQRLINLGVKQTELPAPIISDYKNMPAPVKEQMRLAVEKIRQADFDEAILHLSKAIKISPKNADAYFYRGYAYEMDAFLLNAVKIKADYTKAIALNPKYAEAYVRRAYTSFFNGRDKQAVADINRAIALDAKSARAFYYRAIFARQAPKALADFNQALKLNPNFADAYLSRAEDFADKKKYAQAIADYTRVIKINPNDYRAYEGRAKIYCVQGKRELAAADEEKLVELGGEADASCQ